MFLIAAGIAAVVYPVVVMVHDHGAAVCVGL